jgi:hypothetical protein
MKHSSKYGSACSLHEAHVIENKLRSARKRGVREMQWGKFRFDLLQFSPLIWRRVYPREGTRRDRGRALRQSRQVGGSS